MRQPEKGKIRRKKRDELIRKEFDRIKKRGYTTEKTLEKLADKYSLMERTVYAIVSEEGTYGGKKKSGNDSQLTLF